MISDLKQFHNIQATTKKLFLPNFREMNHKETAFFQHCLEVTVCSQRPVHCLGRRDGKGGSMFQVVDDSMTALPKCIQNRATFVSGKLRKRKQPDIFDFDEV